jgi:hypothetical protein
MSALAPIAESGCGAFPFCGFDRQSVGKRPSQAAIRPIPIKSSKQPILARFFAPGLFEAFRKIQKVLVVTGRRGFVLP